MMKRGRDDIFTASSGSLFSIATFDDESGDADQTSNFTRQSLRAHVFHNRTGLIFESSPNHYDRYNRYHKERPLRIDSLQDYLLQQSTFGFSQRCILLSLDKNDETPSVDLDDSVSEDDETTGFRLQETDFLRVHLHSYLERFKTLELYCSRTCLSTCQDRLDHEQEQYPSVYLTASSFSSAKQASTALCLLVSQVLSSRLQNGFAMVRPPGHHTEPSYTGGYCILNHVAIAASYALSHFSHTVQRILIVDYDVHVNLWDYPLFDYI
jgi:acetoin utilization deacetylase AcuC-like enzyme